MNAAARLLRDHPELFSDAIVPRTGRRVEVSYGGVSATATIAGAVLGGGILVSLDGTDQLISVYAAQLKEI